VGGAGARCSRVALALLLLALLGACANTARQASSSGDGPPANPPPDLHLVPDAQPRVETIRVGGPNKPYEVLGQKYVPMSTDEAATDSGLASWYGRKFHGLPTASGEPYDMYAMSAAHRTWPIPSFARVRNPANGREVIVRINDRGPFQGGRVIDLSYTAAFKLGLLGGVAPVEVQRLTYQDIRSGSWRGTPIAPDAQPTAAAAAPQPAQQDERPAQPAVVEQQAPAAAEPTAAAASGFWVQLGAFRQRQGAHDLRQQLLRELGWLEPLLAIFDERSTYRVQAGPYVSRAEAQQAAERIRVALPQQLTILLRR
jgi:rare lipoprotein A